ncbi:MAG: MlaD family protein [Saprospiraceae bacterium]
MEKTIFQKIKLGIFVVTGLLLFVLGVYFIGAKQSMFGNTTVLFGTFDNINGIKPGNNIRFSGINVGTVKEIKMVNDTLIVLRMSIETDIIRHIKNDATAVITSDGLVGSMIVNIVPGRYSNRAIEANDTIISSSRVRTEDMISTLSVTNENAALLTAELLTITNDIVQGKGVIGALIKDPNMTKDVNEILSNLKATSQSFSHTASQINSYVTSLNAENNILGLLKDTSINTQFKNILQNVETSTMVLHTTLQQLNQASENINETINNVKNGKGAFNYLSNDPALVRNIDHTVVKLDSAAIQIHNAGIKLNENLEALKHIWPFKIYFKNKEEKNK